MVDTFITFGRKSSLPMEIPGKRRSQNGDYLEYSTIEKDFPRRKVSNPISISSFANERRYNNVENKFCCNSRNDSALVGSGGEENSYILLSEQSTIKTNSKIINNIRNDNRSRKISTVLTSRPYMPLNITKKKKSSSGISSSSDDSNFQHQLGVFQDAYRKRSDESMEEISSLGSSPQSPKKLSQDDGKKKIDLGYCSPKISSSENFHATVTKELSGKEKKESLIGLFEQISTTGIQESKVNSIYEFRKNKRRSAVAKQLQVTGNVRKRLSMPNTTSENASNNENNVTNEDKKIASYNPQSHENEKDNRRRTQTLNPGNNCDSKKILTDNTDMCNGDVSLEAPPPPQRRISSTAFEPRRRVSSMTLEELNITVDNNKEIQVSSSNYYKDTSKELSELLLSSSIPSNNIPKRRFSSIIPADSKKLMKNEPKRRFSSALHYLHNEECQAPTFHELQLRFSPNDVRQNSIDVTEERKYGFISTIDKSNNIFVAQIQNEKAQPSFEEDISDNNDYNNSEILSPTTLFDIPNISSSDKICRRYSYNPPHDSYTNSKQAVRKNNSLDLPNDRKLRRTSLTALQNVPWGDKRLSREAQLCRENTIDECSEPTASSKDYSSDGTSTISTLSRQSMNGEGMNPNSYNVFNYPTFYDNEVPVSPEYRTFARSLSSLDNESSGDESDGDDQAVQRPSVIHRPNVKLKCKADNGSDTSSNCNYRTLKEVDSKTLGIQSKSSIASSFDSDYPDYLYRSRSNTQTTIDEPKAPAKDRRRKYGITHITALENIPKRRISLMQEHAYSDRGSCDDQDSQYQENSLTRRFSAYAGLAHPLVTFQDEKDTEVLSDQKTIDVIFDSLDALSSVDNSPNETNSEVSFPFLNNLHESFSKILLPNLEEEIEEYDSPSWCLERRKKQLNLGSFKKDDEMWTPTENKSFFDEKERLQSLSSTPLEQPGTKFSAMFGYFNYFLYVFVTKEHGMDTWKEILKRLELTKIQREMFEKPKHSTCDDSLTDTVLKTSASYLHKNFNLFLQSFGIKYFDYCSEKYGDILKSIATNLSDFINNMDDIRRHIHKIEKIPDDFPPSIHASDDKNGALLMYYKSSHEQMEYFMIGFIKRAASVLFGMRSRISLRHHKKNLNDYSIISIKSVVSLIKKPSLSKLQLSNRCKDLILEPYLMDQVFPFHMILNDKLEIVQLGHSLNRYLENFIPAHGLCFHSYFKLDTPMIEFSFENVRRNLNTAFIISLRRDFFTKFAFVLKGQFVYLDSSKCLWFMGSPKVDYVHNLNSQSNLYLSDIPLHDVTREVLLVGEQKHSVETLKNQLQILTNRLKETSKELALGKINTENILDQMFPKDVAEKLMRDLPVPAVTTKTVSILFTDIVGFTSICEQCDPEEVTVMLNKLYIDFDYLCEKYEIYKVETIGDAYMAVGGLHQTGFDHGRWVTAMGIEMIRLAKNVNIPRTNKNIEIRVGIHSGSVVAGVVGTLMPRYCLFGKNVTLANKMESTSESGRVHISPATYLEVKHHQEFIFWGRSRDELPELMAKSYKGHSFFVTQRRNSASPNIPCSSPEKRQPYMMEQRHGSSGRSRTTRVTSSRKNSRTESVNSEVIRSALPEDLKKQLDALEKINRFDSGKMFCLSDGNSTATS